MSFDESIPIQWCVTNHVSNLNLKEEFIHADSLLVFQTKKSYIFDGQIVLHVVLPFWRHHGLVFFCYHIKLLLEFLQFAGQDGQRFAFH